MNSLAVRSIKVVGNTLRIDFECTGEIKKYFEGNSFFAEYNVSIEAVPESILVIPFLSSVCPIAWATQTEVHVNEVDKRFVQSLKMVSYALQNFYPKIGFDDRLKIDKVTTEAFGSNNKKSMMLYSGGIDSIATYIRHENEHPLLVAVHGSDIDVSDSKRWEVVLRNHKKFSEENELILRTVRSNFYKMVDELMLMTYSSKIEGTWWGRVMHGLALLGLCAPLTYVDRVGTLYIASSFTKDFHKPWGSAPEIDNEVAWSGVFCVHDGFELSRQDKIQLIATYVKQTHKNLLFRVCNKRGVGLTRGQGGNCSSGRCEKCSRTIVGLELAGVNPNNHGFTVSSNTFANIQKSLKRRIWTFADDEKYMWIDIQRHAVTERSYSSSEAKELIDWLKNISIETLESNNTSDQIITRLLIFLAPIFKYIPYSLWKVNRKIYNSLKLSLKRASYKRF